MGAFMKGTDGYVYQCDKGSSFDGEPIEAFVRPVFNHSKSPTVLKHYRSGTVEVESRGYSEISVSPEFSYGTEQIDRFIRLTLGDEATREFAGEQDVGELGASIRCRGAVVLFHLQVIEIKELALMGTRCRINNARWR